MKNKLKAAIFLTPITAILCAIGYNVPQVALAAIALFAVLVSTAYAIHLLMDN
jgi:hypothetical protein